jgi:signal peptidase I
MRTAAWTIGRHPRATIVRVVVIVGFAIVLFGWILLPLRLSGVSMLPTYSSGAFNVANRATYWIREPRRGDVVALRLAGPSTVYVKRIVGMPGERLEIVRGTVMIDGSALAEPHVVQRAPWDYAPVTIGPDELFVIGDNRSMAIENHELGRVKRARILGTLVF